MQWLLTFLVGLLQEIFTFYIKRALHKTAVFLAWATFSTGLFIAFLALVKTSIAAIQVFSPQGLGFALGFFPGIVWDMATIYLTILIAKRVYDWKQSLGKSYYQTKANLY
jgi:hypothetical protein